MVPDTVKQDQTKTTSDDLGLRKKKERKREKKEKRERERGRERERERERTREEARGFLSSSASPAIKSLVFIHVKYLCGVADADAACTKVLVGVSSRNSLLCCLSAAWPKTPQTADLKEVRFCKEQCEKEQMHSEETALDARLRDQTLRL